MRCRPVVALAAAIAVACAPNSYDGVNPDGGPSSLVGASGRRVESADRVFVVDVPPNAVEKDTLLFIGGPSPPAAAGEILAGQIYQLQPEITFHSAVYVEMTYKGRLSEFEELQLANLDAIEPRIGGARARGSDLVVYAFTKETGRFGIIRVKKDTGHASACGCCSGRAYIGSSGRACSCLSDDSFPSELDRICLELCSNDPTKERACLLPATVNCGGRACDVSEIDSAYCCGRPLDAGASMAPACVDGLPPTTSNCAYRAYCDGPEDCSTGQSCCYDPSDASTRCKAACGASAQLCHERQDCAAGAACVVYGCGFGACVPTAAQDDAGAPGPGGYLAGVLGCE